MEKLREHRQNSCCETWEPIFFLLPYLFLSTSQNFSNTLRSVVCLHKEQHIYYNICLPITLTTMMVVIVILRYFFFFCGCLWTPRATAFSWTVYGRTLPWLSDADWPTLGRVLRWNASRWRRGEKPPSQFVTACRNVIADTDLSVFQHLPIEVAWYQTINLFWKMFILCIALNCLDMMEKHLTTILN